MEAMGNGDGGIPYKKMLLAQTNLLNSDLTGGAIRDTFHLGVWTSGPVKRTLVSPTADDEFERA